LYATAFTDSFPVHLRNFSDSRNEEMIEKLDVDKAVFCRVIRTPVDGGEIRFPKYHFPGVADDSDDELTLEQGNIFLIRYSAVRRFIMDGDVELI
jgi:GINS complex subunit 4